MQTEISRFGRVGFSRFQQQQEVGLEASGQFLSEIEALVMLVPLARVSARSEMKLTTQGTAGSGGNCWCPLVEQPTPVLLAGKSHGYRSMVGYSPWGLKELDTTERLHFLSFLVEKIVALSMPKMPRELLKIDLGLKIKPVLKGNQP